MKQRFNVDNVECNVKYSHSNVINPFRQLNNVEPVDYRGTIQTASRVNSITKTSGCYDIGSDIVLYNHKVLTCCDTLQSKSIHNHCCMYSCGVLHNVDVLSVNTNGSTVGCIYVYPAAGDDISWFYEYGFDNKISKLSSIPAGDLIVTLQYTVDILSCNISVVGLDSVTAKIDFDNVVKAHHKYGMSYTDSCIVQLTC